jgi:hypothetical protein
VSYIIYNILHKLICNPQTKQLLNTWLVTNSDAYIDKERKNDGMYMEYAFNRADEMYVKTSHPIRWKQSFKFHISTGVSVVVTFYLLWKVLMSLYFLFEHFSNLSQSSSLLPQS